MAFDREGVQIISGKDSKLRIARGKNEGVFGVHKFGANPSIAASSTEDITFSGVINWLEAATAVRVKAGGNAADASAGAGARKISIEGLDENWAEASEELTLNANGTLASGVTTVTFIRIFRVYVTDTGTYTGVNTGNIVIENGSGGTDLITIPAGLGQTETTEYTVPAGKTAYLTRIAATVDAAKAVDMIMWQRRNADDVTTPFTAKRHVADFPQLIGEAREKFDAYIAFPAKTDLWWTGTTGSGAAPSCEADYDLIVVDDV